MVAIDLLKKRYNQGLHSNLYFFRDQTGNEVDLVIDRGSTIIPIEIKSAKTPSPDFCKGLKTLRIALPDAIKGGYVIYDGSSGHSLDSFKFLNWRNMNEIRGLD
jgi:predicted AAA+ superfamily ATPase